ncbi:hypothetical protein vBAbaPP1_181 [Acinetobacter phage vB_AbaM_P1]|nr:hypothetical protein vBAbaPP1_181 [Acinetobacter phage vB_AbaM_P1]WAX22662.1 hypothetical protein [Acinetobacter phage vB_AbaP_HB01]
MKKQFLYEMLSTGLVNVESEQGNHKENVLNILNAFRDYVNNPTSRSIVVLETEGSRNMFNLSSGLCGNITCLFTYHNNYSIQMIKLFREWPNYSGDDQHPIRTIPKELEGEHNEYAQAYIAGYGMYDKDSEYCKKRLELLDFIIEKVSENFSEYVWVI